MVKNSPATKQRIIESVLIDSSFRGVIKAPPLFSSRTTLACHKEQNSGNKLFYDAVSPRYSDLNGEK